MDLPDENMRPNAYGQSRGSMSKASIANAFSSAGWSMRKCAWDEYEIENEFSELIIEGNDYDNLINGWILNHEDNIKKIAVVFENLGMKWSFEIYDESGEQIAFYHNHLSTQQGSSR